MIIKTADDKTQDILVLQALMTRPDASEQTRRNIEREIRNIQAGLKGEREAAYEMEFHYGQSKNWMILHDLRIECQGRVAQIDHLLINRFLEIWVCESKHFAEGIAINDHGECSAFFAGRPYGIPSPLEQNRKHLAVLESAIQSKHIKPPTRLGISLPVSVNSLVLVSKGARITRPKAKIEGMDTVIKNDQLKSKIDKVLDTSNNIMTLAKVVGQETIEAFARDIAAIHKPIVFHWADKFGLSTETPQPAASVAVVQADEEKPKSKLICASCGVPITYNVAKFCWFNKARFGENVYCMDCQKKF
ncbi:MAG TPA: NERD domain-containing protein [bacterium]|nr:NERD domain-containing protein [bacterium]